MSTFQFNDVEIQVLKEFKTHNLTQCVEGKKFFDANHDKILQTSTQSPNSAKPCFGNGLLGTIYQAYSQHIPLTLRPDDLWMAILVNFGRYVQNHSEQVRSLFVDHLGRKELVVSVTSPYLEHTTEEHWTQFVGLMAQQIQKNTKNEIVEWMTPTFSTTTSKDRMVAQLALMSTVKEYFACRFELCCGLSQVTLQGNLEDWQQLVEKAKRLYQFQVKEFTDWADLLVPVLEQFVQAYQGQVNEDFWQRICTSKRRGSGGQQDLKGWFLVFAPFDDSGKYVLKPLEEVHKNNVYGVVDDDAVPECALDVSVVVDDLDSKRHHVVFYGGLLMTQYDQDKNTMSPTVDWLMIEKKEITYLDLHQSLLKSFEKSSSSRQSSRQSSTQSADKQKIAFDLLRFAYNVAVQLHFPNEKLMDLIKEVKSYYGNFLKKTDVDNFGPFLEFLAEQKHFGYEPNMFAKYIDPSQLPVLLKSCRPTD